MTTALGPLYDLMSTSRRGVGLRPLPLLLDHLRRFSCSQHDSKAYREGREVAGHVSSNRLRVPDTNQRTRRRSGTVRLRCERCEGRMPCPLAKLSLPLNVAHNLRRVGRESVARSHLHFLGYVTVKRQGI